MAKISEGNGRRRQSFYRQGHFASRSKPFWRPSDLTHFAHCCVGKLGNIDILPSLAAPQKPNWALSKMASNLEGEWNRP